MLATYAKSRDLHIRTCIIERHDQLACSMARRFVRPGVPFEDLAQSARMALIGAVDRFDPTQQAKFSTYAATCMLGEIKRYFRDRTWVVKVSRRLQELYGSLPRTQDRLHGELQRVPTLCELAAASNATEEEVIQAMDVWHVYKPLGLDDRRELEEGGEGMTIEETVGVPDGGVDRMVEQAPLEAAINTLDERLQQIVRLRFMAGFSQREVGDTLCLSQMHVSRLERSALKALREVMSVVRT